MVTNKRLCSGTLGDANATLYTVPADTMAIVKNLVLCNTTASAVTVTLKLDGIEIIAGKSLAANETLIVGQLDQIIEAAELIEGSAGTAAAVKYYMSGKEISA